MISRRQLVGLGLPKKAIDRRLAAGRLHSLWPGIYAVGRPGLTRRGWWRAALLACGPDAVLSHASAAELWGFGAVDPGNEGSRERPEAIHVSVPPERTRRLRGIRVHRRADLRSRDRTRRDGIAATTPGRTLIDLATLLQPGQLESAINEADKLGWIDPERLRREVERHRGMGGVKKLRRLLDRRTFRLTDSELERRFLRLVRRAGLPQPLTQQRVAGFRVDFFWADVRLVVETDGLRYHRTPTQQSRDRIRDQALVASGFVALRFTHAQVAFEREHVIRTLRSVAVSMPRPRYAGSSARNWTRY